MKSAVKKPLSMIRLTSVLFASLVFFMGPYLQAVQMSGIISDPSCSCGDHCCCRVTTPTGSHCQADTGRKSCGCDMNSNPAPAKAPLEGQIPDSKPGDQGDGSFKGDYKIIGSYIIAPEGPVFPAPIAVGPPIYIAVSSFII